MQISWTRPLPVPPAGLCLARESGTLLLRDHNHHLNRYDRSGHLELRQRAPASMTASCIADDGRTIAVVGRRGQVWLLTLDFVPIWERALPARPIALALDVLGERLAVSDQSGGLSVFDRNGSELWRISVVKPLLHLAFVPELPILIGCAEYGFVCAIDSRGETMWRDGLVAHVGSMAVSGDGAHVVLACYTEGLNRYSATEPKRTSIARAAPSRLVALDYEGHQLMTTGLANELALRGSEGEIHSVLLLPANALALTINALSTEAVVALANDTLVGVVRDDEPRGAEGQS